MFSTSAYKWYGPHAGITWLEPELLDRLPAYKVRPAPDRGPGRFELGTTSFENMASITAAVEFIGSVSLEALTAHEGELFGRLLDGLLDDDRVTVYGPHDLADRAPTLAFNVAGHSPADVARALAGERIAVWDGHYYALEVMASYGIDGAVRAGIAAYLTIDDVDRLLDAVRRL